MATRYSNETQFLLYDFASGDRWSRVENYFVIIMRGFHSSSPGNSLTFGYCEDRLYHRQIEE